MVEQSSEESIIFTKFLKCCYIFPLLGEQLSPAVQGLDGNFMAQDRGGSLELNLVIRIMNMS
jgi:hypothetical protein